MADLAITASQVLPGADSAGAVFEQGIAAVAVTAGQVVYQDTSLAGIQYKLADNNSTAPEAVAKGIALHAASAGQPLRIQTRGLFTIGAGAAPAVAKPYFLSGTPGAIAPVADLVTGMRATLLGIGVAGNQIQLNIWASQQVTP